MSWRDTIWAIFHWKYYGGRSIVESLMLNGYFSITVMSYLVKENERKILN